jgi:TRAP-type C4-dicarboxylate transport system substrate-binding protein
MKRARLVLAASLLLAASGGEAQVVVKLGTLAPHGSAWHEILKDLGRSWAEASGGAVTLKVYAGGVQGSEGDMIRKLGIGQLQAAALTNVGMQDITTEPKALSIPLLFADERQADCAFEAVRPELDEALLRRSYVVLHWSRLGPMHLFCTEARRTPAELAGARLFAQDGDPKANDAWREAGFRPVVLASTDMLPALQTGMIDCVPSLPLYVLTAALYDRARHMLDLPWGHLYGATIVRRDAWERIAPELRARLLEASRAAGRASDAVTKRLSADALVEMKRRGLVVEHADAAPWKEVMARLHPRIRGELVPAPFFDRLVAARDKCAAAPR